MPSPPNIGLGANKNFEKMARLLHRHENHTPGFWPKTTLLQSMNLRILTLFLAGILCFSAYGQDDDWTKSLFKGLGNAGAKKKAELDQIDFQFAMSVNENAGLFDVEQKGEGLAKGLYALKERSEKTKEEIARDTLEYAIQYYNWRLYAIAEASFMEAKGYMEANQLTEDINYLRCLSNIGLVYLVQGRMDESRQYIEDALARSERMQGVKSAAYAANLNSLAKLGQELGKYNEAEKQFNQTLDICKEVFGETSMQGAIVLNNKAMLYQELGRYDQAVGLMKEAIAKEAAAPKKVLEGKKSFDSRRFQLNLATLYQLSGDLPRAEATLLEIKKVFENRFQKNNPEYASLLNQLGLLYIEMGKMDQVEEQLAKAVEVYKKKFTENNAAYARALNDLGNFYRMQKRYDEAEKALSTARATNLSLLGANHPDYVKSVEDLAILYWKKNDLAKAKTFYGEAIGKSLDFINHYFPPMSEAEKTKYWDVLQPRFQRFFNYAIAASATDPTIVRDMFNYQMATKALLLSATSKIKQTILASGDKALINDYLSWIAQKETLARYYALSKEDLQKQEINLAALEAQANNLERSLSERSKDFSSGYATETVTYAQVAALLSDTEAVVDIIRLQGFDEQLVKDSKYVVMVVKKGDALPAMAVIDNGSQLETRYSKFYKNSILQRTPDGYSYDQYWGKIDPLVAGKKTIYFSPDGIYNQINVNTLKKEGGDYVLGRYDLVVLGNSKDLLEIKAKKPASVKKDAFLLGFPNYGGNAVAALPGTKVELEAVSKILKSNGYTVSTLSGAEASEKNLKAVKGPQLMHIATHGYFLADGDVGSGGAAGVNAENAKGNPLLRSGLLLAGASRTLSGHAIPDLQSNDNGVLTAYEAMNLSLEGTDLIILSACETGLGDVRAGEGVYGLQRAFQVAGARALIMSLWKVDDVATQLLMTNFYTYWAKGGSKLKAFRQAQLKLMAQYKDPYYWGAFVMMGE